MALINKNLYIFNKIPNKKIIFGFYFFFLITTIDCFIKLPIKYYPEQIFNETNPSTIFQNLINQRLYATIELGSPKQTIQIPVEFGTNDFYISKSYEIENDAKSNIFNIKHFNEKSSTSIQYLEEQEIYYGVNFFLGTKAKDYFYFGNKQVELEFFLTEHLTEIVPGELGLQLNPISDLNTAFDSIEKSFLKIMKNNGLTNNYAFSILYENTGYDNYNNDKNDGYLYIGDYLHDIDKKYDYNKLTSINAKIYQNEVQSEFLMNKLVIYKNNNPQDIIKEIELSRNYLNVILDFNYCGIKGSEIIHPYLEQNIFTKENNCYKGTFWHKGKYIFYYCNNNPSTIKKIKNNFPTLKFTHQDFNYDFIINPEDIFVEKGEYVYFLMVFEDYKKYEWRFGRPFLNKYTFMLDHDSKKILFYSVEDIVSYKGMKKGTSSVLIIFLVIIFSVLGFILARKIYKIHNKKRANVLEDDFEYQNAEDKYKKGSNIEMSKNLFYDN